MSIVGCMCEKVHVHCIFVNESVSTCLSLSGACVYVRVWVGCMCASTAVVCVGYRSVGCMCICGCV